MGAQRVQGGNNTTEAMGQAGGGSLRRQRWKQRRRPAVECTDHCIFRSHPHSQHLKNTLYHLYVADNAIRPARTQWVQHPYPRELQALPADQGLQHYHCKHVLRCRDGTGWCCRRSAATAIPASRGGAVPLLQSLYIIHQRGADSGGVASGVPEASNWAGSNRWEVVCVAMVHSTGA